MRFEKQSNHSAAVDAFLAGDAPALLAALPEDVAFHSPVADYEGGAARTVLTTLTTVIDRPVASSVTADGERTILRFSAGLAGERGEGVMVLEGRDMTLFIRPLHVLQGGIERMRTALASRARD